MGYPVPPAYKPGDPPQPVPTGCLAAAIIMPIVTVAVGLGSWLFVRFLQG